MLKISNSIASVTVGSSSPTYREAEGAEDEGAGAGGMYCAGAGAGMDWGGCCCSGASTGAAAGGEVDILVF